MRAGIWSDMGALSKSKLSMHLRKEGHSAENGRAYDTLTACVRCILC